KLIYEAYIKRMTTKEIMALLNIKENTLKYHNKNLYQKLGVSSRKELQEIHSQLDTGKMPEVVQDTV
ncbi:MAG: LuxR family transcriptional regulator, partial [Clostridia bacterium]|nr:LuxR family transcriptional regulator [Clostridia bacterium]